MSRLRVLLLLAAAVTAGDGLPEVIKIGGLFEHMNDDQEMALRYAVDRVNADPSLMPTSRLSVKVERIKPRSSFHAAKALCSLLEDGVVTIFGPSSAATSSLVDSTSDALHLPHLETHWNFRLPTSRFSVNVFPHVFTLSKAFYDLVQAKKWKSFTVIYEDNEGLIKLQELLKLSNKKIFLQQFTPSQQYRKLLKDIHRKGETNIVLDVPTSRVTDILREAQGVGMLSEYHNYLLTSLDFHTLDLSEFQHIRTNMTGFKLVDASHSYLEGLVPDWHDGKQASGKFSNKRRRQVKTQTALVMDAVILLAKSLDGLDRIQRVNVRNVSCSSPLTWPYGHDLLEFMKTVTFSGVTGFVHLDSHRARSNFSLDIMELKHKGVVQVGKWDPVNGVVFTRNYTKEYLELSSLENITLRVTTILTDPYSMVREDADHLTENVKFEGFCVDLIHEICKLRGCKYDFRMVSDKKYGNKNDQGEWDGMIREVIDRKADLAIADLTITYEREEAVDFTMPFMNLGISILYRKPTKKVPKLFSFLAPFSLEVWVYMATAYLGVSLLLFIMARFTPYEWVSPHPCNPSPDFLENNFSLLNSFWFTIGSLMQQGSDLAPRAMSTRLIAAIWWFFTLIMISSYTANLAAFLTVERMKSPIESAEDLARQSSIQYGCVSSGSTKSFFKDSKIQPYKRMWAVMENARPTVFTDSNTKGVERVKKGNYAFLMESTSIEYITERNCDLTRIGGLLDSKGYGIAMPPGSPYRAAISSAILKLQEDGVLHFLKERWWKMKGGNQCRDDDKKLTTSASELGLENVGGVFVVLLAGLGFAAVIAVVEFIWKTKKIPRDQRRMVVVQLLCDLKDVIACRGSSRPVPANYLDDPFHENGLPMKSSSSSMDTLDARHSFT